MLGKSTKENKPSVEVGSGAGVFRFENIDVLTLMNDLIKQLPFATKIRVSIHRKHPWLFTLSKWEFV